MVEMQPRIIEKAPATVPLEQSVHELVDLADTLPEGDARAEKAWALYNRYSVVSKDRDVLVTDSAHWNEEINRIRRELAPETKVSEEYKKEQSIRERYEQLLQKRTALEADLASWRSVLRRDAVRRSLDTVQRHIATYNKQFPFVTEPRRHLVAPAGRAIEQHYQAERFQAVRQSTQETDHQFIHSPNPEQVKAVALDVSKKTIALHKADIAQELQELPLTEEHRMINAVADAKAALEHTPGLFQNLAAWYDNCTAREAEFKLYAMRGPNEAGSVSKYWTRKLEVLTEIKPLFVGRQRWQQEYGQAIHEKLAVDALYLKSFKKAA